MVKSSGIREKFRSNVLKELARERSIKRPKSVDSDEDSDDEEQTRLNQERMFAKAKTSDSSLVALLPKPKNSSAFGPTIKIAKMLKMPERTDHVSHKDSQIEMNSVERIAEDGMLEIDVSKVVGDVSQSLIRDLTVEKSKPTVIIPKGREKRKNQITYLAQLGKATELERKEQAAQSRINKAAARSKYGW